MWCDKFRPKQGLKNSEINVNSNTATLLINKLLPLKHYVVILNGKLLKLLACLG